jgi:hypothetical protein
MPIAPDMDEVEADKSLKTASRHLSQQGFSFIFGVAYAPPLVFCPEIAVRKLIVYSRDETCGKSALPTLAPESVPQENEDVDRILDVAIFYGTTPWYPDLKIKLG